MPDASAHGTSSFPRDVMLEGGPLDGRTATVAHPATELHCGGSDVVYRITPHDPNVWRYVEQPVTDPLRELAQAILDNRVVIRTEFYETRDLENIAYSEIRVQGE